VPDINPFGRMAPGAPLGIMICGDLNLAKHSGAWMLDGAAAAQNLLLASHALGLGAVWTGVWPVEERVNGFSSLLNLPREVIPLALIIIGHPAETPKPEDRFREDRIHHNRF